MGREVQNADHVGWHSWRTLEALLDRHEYSVLALNYYRHPRFVPSPGTPLKARLRCLLFNVYQSAIWPILAVAPALPDGLLVVAQPRGADDR